MAIAVLMWLTTLTTLITPDVPFVYSAPFLLLVLFVALPIRLGWLSIPSTVAVLWGLSYLNSRKIAAIELPITYFDLRMVTSEPAALANALGFAWSTRLLLAMASAGSAGALIIVAIVRKGMRDQRVAPRRRTWPARLGAAALIALIGVSAIVQYASHIRTTLPQRNTALWLDLWIPEKQAGLSLSLGVPEYLAFSWLAEELSLEQPGGQLTTVDSSMVGEAVGHFVKPQRVRTMLPNIVLFHAESTFDPNRAFRLSAPITLPLWSGVSTTRAIGPLRVNIVGGGSWVTDFEVMSGVDTRLFGFQGNYTTYYVAPMVRYSLPRFAASKGYVTKAFSTVSGETYNYRNAFRHYGFDQFVDGLSLGMSPDWSTLKDRDFVAAIIRAGAFNHVGESSPFFYYVDTTENHGPHPCRAFKSMAQLAVTYADLAAFDENCQLNEYVLRAQSTSDAFTSVLRELEAIEMRTGRPYVLLAYGDHQPWDFTDGLYSAGTEEVTDASIRSLSAVRTSASLKETFFHLVASESETITLGWQTTAPPATLLPSLISAYMTSSSDELYMVENLVLNRYCGKDVVLGCARVGFLAHQARSRLLAGR